MFVLAAGGGAFAAEGFQWNRLSGATIKVLFSDHPYANAIVSRLPEFEEKTGIKVDYSITPEGNYYDKLNTALSGRSGDPDVFMLGPTSVWEYAPSEYISPLDDLIANSDLTDPTYDMADFFPSVVGAFRWDGVYGHKLGEGSLWSLPMGCEVYDLAYNKRIFAEKGLTPPKTVEDLRKLCVALNEFNGPGTYAFAVRGAREWPTVYTGYMSMHTMYGGTDFKVVDGKLISQANSPESVKMTEMWVDLIKTGGAPDWSGYTWYQIGADLGAGKAAMMFDADNNGYYQNVPGASQEAGNLAWTTAPLPPGKTEVFSNYWCWAMSINNYSKNKEAAWMFMQYFTTKDYLLWAAMNAKQFDPVRASVMNAPEFVAFMSKNEGYKESFDATIKNTAIHYIPQPYFAECGTEWAATIQDIVAGQYPSVQEGMDVLAAKINEIVSDITVE
jgi:multiple sugar transport system substrate-binding protein